MSLVNARIHNTFYGRFLLRVLLLQPADHKNMKLFELILFKFNPSFKALNWWTWKTENLQRKQDSYEYHLSFNIKIVEKTKYNKHLIDDRVSITTSLRQAIKTKKVKIFLTFSRPIECEQWRQHSWKRLINNVSEVCFGLK